ncbi:Hpt domain-containing protein [Maribacter polysaccharolyticus]|uniref:Hpt domain-containing protein n=1 Tax=Maribacter polysaccharolyticus TaxID=3020831 RepID=UPI00237F03F1|nr:Hpt domain-containing protein [Maribacter polysaccharolyticus]MDE3742647.1 Hpt domain-containing protein [Maribacter polysaccharolyticus]
MKEQPNLNYIKELAGEDVEFENKFIAIIKDEFPEEVDIYLNHIVAQEPRAASEIVHKLKHKFSILSMEDAYRFAVIYEEHLRTGNTDLDLDFRRILNTITSYLKTI